MNSEQLRDVSKSVLTSMTEDEFANWHHEQGIPIIQHRGRYWKRTVIGFYEPLHWMARLSAQEATNPTILSWGFRATLNEDDAKLANGAIPVHLLSNVSSYGLHSISANRRQQLRKCQKKVKIFELTGSELLQQQGYEVLVSAAARTKYWTVPSKTDYLASLSNYVDPKRRLILVGLIDGKLGGYIDGYAVSGTAYIDRVYISTEALTTNINLGLDFEFVQACQRSGTIHEIVCGLHTPEDQKLCTFKEAIGLLVKHIPTRVQINPIMAQFLQWRYPYKYYRLTGTLDNNNLLFRTT